MTIYDIRDSCRANFNKYTRKIYKSIPVIGTANILDLGCGTGVSTLEIAKLTSGHVLAIDSDNESILRLQEKIKKMNYEEKITVIHDSVFSVKIKKCFFDIILAEGLFNIIGFKKGLGYFSGFIKEKGYFIIHDDTTQIKRKRKLISKYHFSILDLIHFNEETWGREYIDCLEKKINLYKKNNKGTYESDINIINIEKEIESYRKNSSLWRSVCYVLQKF
jgi:cyclopropane fatty-acyl-phospholipid synthase-like methyltransferase